MLKAWVSPGVVSSTAPGVISSRVTFCGSGGLGGVGVVSPQATSVKTLTINASNNFMDNSFSCVHNKKPGMTGE